MQPEVVPEPARIGPFVEGAMLYTPVRRVIQLAFLGVMAICIGLEWAAWVLRLE